MIISCTTIQIFFRLVYDTRFDRVIVNVIQFLDSKPRTVTFLGLIVLSPELAICISAVLFPSLFEYWNHPLFPAFLFVADDGVNNFLAGKFLEVSKRSRQIINSRRSQQMHVTAHYTPTVQPQLL